MERHKKQGCDILVAGIGIGGTISVQFLKENKPIIKVM